jgi:hypothetical protein
MGKLMEGSYNDIDWQSLKAIVGRLMGDDRRTEIEKEEISNSYNIFAVVKAGEGIDGGNEDDDEF